jgi:murein tripeptide amidase MpaA
MSARTYDPSRYYRFDELAAVMHAVAEAFPHLVKVYSIGRSLHGRDLWLAEVTRFSTGPGEEKPGYWMDGNTHATELAGSAACLYALDLFTRLYGEDEDVTRLLDSRVVYILPRLSPDGAEYCLVTGDTVRSANRPYPFEERWEGLRAQDVNGDGRILQMRIADPRGEWKVCDRDPRLLVKRGPDDYKGDFYRIFREGVVEDWNRFRVEVKPHPYGMDFNRNYPYRWVPEYDQGGAGRYPLSEPETRAVVDFLQSHKNVCGVQTYHTYSAAILRPFSMKSDDDMPATDLDTYKALGERGTEITGYPCISVYHDFRSHPKEFIRGGFDDMCYEHLGIFAFTTEIWSIGKAAGLEVKDHIKFLGERSTDDLLKIMEWHDYEDLDAFVPWKPFEHPQLGPVEIGGWQTLFSWSNPPPRFLPEICDKLTRFSMAHALASPRLVLEGFEEEVLSREPVLRKLTLAVQNEGYLPTHVSSLALRRKIVRPIEVTLDLGDGVEVLMGKARTELEHLDGVTNVVNSGYADTTYYKGTTERHRQKLEWLVRGAGPVGVTVRSERAGILRARID